MTTTNLALKIEQVTDLPVGMRLSGSELFTDVLIHLDIPLMMRERVAAALRELATVLEKEWPA